MLQGRPAVGPDLASSLSQIDFESSRSEMATVANFENADLSPGSSVMEVEDPFAMCQKPEIKGDRYILLKFNFDHLSYAILS